MKLLFQQLCSIIIFSFLFSISYAQITDLDGNTYTVGDFGTQSWTLTNYRSTQYADGTPIPEYTGSNVGWNNLTTGAYCHYQNDTANDAKYGLYYNHHAVIGKHDNDPSTPNKVFGVDDYAAARIENYVSLGSFMADNDHNHTTTKNAFTSAAAMAGGYWAASSVAGSPGAAGNSGGIVAGASGFAWLASGYRDANGFGGIGSLGPVWTATSLDWGISETYGIAVGLITDEMDIDLQAPTKNWGFTMRLVNDNVCEEYDSSLPFNESCRYGNNINCWTKIDHDGDGRGWFGGVGSYGVFGVNPSFVSASTGQSGTIYPDNWVISPAFDLSDYQTSNGLMLTYKVTGRDSEWSQEHYSVYVSSGGNDIADFAEALFEETLPASGNGTGESFKEVSLDMSEFAGMANVYIAFRHHDCAGERELHIRDISLESEFPLGQAEITSSELLIYPNPNSGKFSLKYGENQVGNSQIQIFSALGQLVLSMQDVTPSRAPLEIDLGNMPKGFYTLVVQGEDYCNQKQIILE